MLKAKQSSREKTDKSKAIAEATREDVKRLNVIVHQEKYKEFFIKARSEGYDMSKLVNQWIDEYLDE